MESRQQSFRFLNGIERQKWAVSQTQEHTLSHALKLQHKVRQFASVHPETPSG